MPPPPQDQWNTGRRIDILVLGPMGDTGDPTAGTGPIRDAVRALFPEPGFDELLTRKGIGTPDRSIHIPDGINEPEIIHSILTRLDIADLVIFNLSPKPGKDEASPNVFYELGLVHALGIPALIVKTAAGQVPFYAQGMRQLRIPDFQRETLMNALRQPLADFLDTENSLTNFCNDRVTQFYGLPIVDISAAVGLATGYYQNFLSRLITEGGFIESHSKLIRQVVVVRPSGVASTYPADMETLRTALHSANLTLETAKLSPPANDPLGPLWFDHVLGVVLDLPRTIYPLQRSPRLFGEQLLDRVEAAIRYQMRQDAQRVRSSILHFSTIREAPSLVTRLLAA
jgi:nucleoside 2-deoxyribosyltransferase